MGLSYPWTTRSPWARYQTGRHWSQEGNFKFISDPEKRTSLVKSAVGPGVIEN